ncbi:CTP synthetase, partial [Shigella sonnei]|nr:CTP synthetase [Shigella sonnei]
MLQQHASEELETKIAQNATKTLREYGIQANMLVLRSEVPITTEMRDKIAMFCDVAPEAVIQSLDVEHLYQIPLNLQA